MPDLQSVNRLDREGFVALLGTIFEHSPWIAEAAWETRPFADLDSLHGAMIAAVEAVPERHRGLVDAHPDLGGKLARAGDLEPHSADEQGRLGLDRLSDAEFERFDRLNRAYRERFGFPFIIAVRENTRATVLDAFERRLANDPATEFRTALDEIAKIARFRLEDLVG